MSNCRLVLALVLPALPAIAQKVGEAAPDIEWARTFNFGDVPAQKLSQLRGSVVLLECWATWCVPCLEQIPKLNELYAVRGEQGLVVVGLSDEEEDLVARFVGRKKMNYPVAVAKDHDFRVQGIPHAFLIGVDGKLLWRGHPNSLTPEILDPALAGATPLVACTGLEEVQALRRDNRHGEAYERMQQLLQEGKLSERATMQARQWSRMAEEFVAANMREADDPAIQQDGYQLWLRLEPVASRYAGVPGAGPAGARLQQLLADGKAKREIDAGRRLAEAQQLEARMQFDAAHAIYKEVASKFGTIKAGKTADASMRALEKANKLGYDPTCAYCKAGEAACPTHSRTKKRK